MCSRCGRDIGAHPARIERDPQGHKQYVHRDVCQDVEVTPPPEPPLRPDERAPIQRQIPSVRRPTSPGTHKTPGRGGKSTLEGQVWSAPANLEKHRRISQILNERPDYN